MNSEAVVDLAFPITPGSVPMDHGYALYAAISRAVPELHGADWLAIHPLSGQKAESTLILTRGSAVTLRLPASRIAMALALSGRDLRIGPQTFLLGSPVVRGLQPSPSLFSWQVAMRLTKPPTRAEGELDMDAFRLAFEAEATRQLQGLGIHRPLELLGKRVVRVKQQQIIAFSVEVRDLSAEQSLLLQASGLGGKRRMGCGSFRSSRSGARP